MKILSLIGVLALSIMVLAACGGSGSENQVQGKSLNTKTVHNNNNQGSSEDSGSHSQSSSTQGSNERKRGASKDQGNQVDLKIGDTGNVKSNINHYKITLGSAEIKDQVAGNKSMLDELVVIQIKVKNIGNKNMKAEDVVSALEITEDLKGSGTDDISGNIGLKPFEGVIAPGESKEGKLIFDAYSAKKYYLVDGSGLADQGAGLQNKVIWTFKASEAQ